MQTVVIVIHLLIVIALVGVVLIQRSEGGGLGVGGGSGFMSARGSKNALTRLTGILAGCFFITSIVLTVLQSTSGHISTDILDRVPVSGQSGEGAATPNVGEQLGVPGAAGNAPVDNSVVPDSAAVPNNAVVPDSAVVPDNSSVPDHAAPVAPAPEQPAQSETQVN